MRFPAAGDLFFEGGETNYTSIFFLLNANGGEKSKNASSLIPESGTLGISPALFVPAAPTDCRRVAKTCSKGNP